MQEFLDRLKENPALAGGLLGGAALLAVVIAVNLGGEPETPISAPSTTGAPLDLFGRGDEEGLAGIAALDCSDYLELEEVDEAFASSSFESDGRDIDLRKEGEVCDYVLSQDDRYFVRLEPGERAEFDPDGTLLGVKGEPVPDLGDEAFWFGGPDAIGGGASGALSVRQSTPLGVLHFRIVLGRPDLDSPDQLAIARALASKALPRFPGMPLLAEAEPIVNLCELVTDEEADQVLAPYRDAHPATMDEVFVTSLSADGVDLRESGESECTKLILAEIYIRIQQGSSGDFESGAEMEGVTGEPVPGVGDAAIWFAGVPFVDPFTAPHEQGVISVRLGEAYFKIVVSLPDTSDSSELEIATDLARTAAARVSLAPDALAALTIPIPPDQAPRGYMDNLLVGEEAGKWTRGEGLVATLRLLANEADGADVMAIDHEDFDFGADVLAVAKEYAENGPDEGARLEIGRLLQRLFPSQDDLTAALETGTDASYRQIRVAARVGRQVYAQEESGGWCMESFGVPGPCLTRIDMPDLADSYFLARPIDDLWGWTQTHYDWAVDVFRRSAAVLEPLGTMPPVQAFFLPFQRTILDHYAGDFDLRQEGGSVFDCGINIGTEFQGDEKRFKQRLAALLADCLLRDEIGSPWNKGLIAYLSSVIYPEFNVEHVFAPTLREQELNTTLGQRRFTNWIFFEYLHPFNEGEEGNLALARFADPVDLLGGLSGMGTLFHDFERALSDATVSDLGGGTVPYDPQSWTLEITGPIEGFKLDPPPFGVRRLKLVVSGNEYACIAVDPRGEVEVSWREGGEGTGGGSWDDPPDAISGESILVVTTVTPGGFATLTVKDVGDNQECEDDENGPYNPPPPDCPVFCTLSHFILSPDDR